MAIAKLKPDTEVPIVVTTPEMIEAPAKSIFTSLVPETKINSLLKYVEGYPWTVNFYGQILNVNNTNEHFDPSSPNLTQPYYKVNGLVLQVSSPLSSSYNQSTGITTVTGSSLVPFKITPNVGDIFIAQVDSGEDAIFHITSVTRKTHRKDSLYEVDYSLHSYTSDQPNFVSTLEQRINEVYYFNKDTSYFNRDVLLKPSVKEAIDRIKNFLIESKAYYFQIFIQRRTGSLLIPGVDNTIYDPLITEFISKTVDYSTINEGRYFRPSYESDDLKQRSILDSLLTRTSPHYNIVNRTYNFVPSTMLPIRARLGTLSNTGVQYILYPTTPNRDHLSFRNPEPPSSYISSIKNAKNYHLRNNRIIQTTTNNTDVFDKPLLHELFVEDFYIVSENFYLYLEDNTKYNDISYIELLISKFITSKTIAKEDLAIAVENYKDWSLLHQFYLLPVIWLMCTGEL